MTVRSGTPTPGIGTVDALERTRLAAPSIAYSASAGGTCCETELLKKLGIEEQVKRKSRRIQQRQPHQPRRQAGTAPLPARQRALRPAGMAVLRR